MINITKEWVVATLADPIIPLLFLQMASTMCLPPSQTGLLRQVVAETLTTLYTYLCMAFANANEYRDIRMWT